jgi:hypothetical protein
MCQNNKTYYYHRYQIHHHIHNIAIHKVSQYTQYENPYVKYTFTHCHILIHIEVIHIVSYSYTYKSSTLSHTHTHTRHETEHIVSCIHIKTIKTYASHGGIGLLELCPLPSGVSLKSPWTNEFPDPPSYSPGAPIVAGGV